MKHLDREQFSSLLKAERVKQRLCKELRFVPEEIENWEYLELLAVTNRSKSEGILLVELINFYVVPYELRLGITDKQTGRSKPITCDFCLTWQQGSKAGRITFERASDKHKFSYLCCGDLACSLHIRNMTSEAVLSRTQLREDITVEQRIARLNTRVSRIITTLDIQPISSNA